MKKRARLSGSQSSIINWSVEKAKSIACAFGCYLVLSLSSSPILAQVSPSAGSDNLQLEDIVVTAQRRSENLQSVPIAVSVLSPSEVQAAGLTDIQSFTGAVPSLNVTQNGPQAVSFLRGVGSSVANPNGEQSVAIYIDGVYMYTPVGMMFPLSSDLAQVAILKGPQGTLFGRNSTAGVIQITTKDPSQQPSGEFSIGYGNYDTVTSSFYGTTGIAPSLAADLSFNIKYMGKGFGEDTTTGKYAYQTSEGTVKTKWLWTPTEDTEIRTTLSFTRVTGDVDNISILPGHVGLDGVVSTVQPYDTNGNWPSSWNGNTYLFAVQADQNLGFAKLENILSYREVDPANFSLDDDVGPLPIINATISSPSTTYTEELRLLSPSGSRINWVAGIYAIDGKTNLYPLGLGGFGVSPSPLAISVYEYDYQTMWAIAGYSQATIEVLPDTNFTAGVRYNEDHLYHQGTRIESPIGNVLQAAIPGDQSYDNTSWRGSLDHKWTPEIMTYVSANRGFKSGGYNLADQSATLGKSYAPYLPEELTAYEIGVKSELLDHRFRLNMSAYHYNYVDIQVLIPTPEGELTYNGPSAKFNGIDADFDALITKEFSISGGFNYESGYYGEFPKAVAYYDNPAQGSFLFNATGKSTVYTPLWSGNLALKYTLSTRVGEFAFNANANFMGKEYTGVDNRLNIPEHVVENDTVIWTPSHGPLSVTLWTLNAFNKVYFNNLLETGTGDWTTYAPPRTYGLTLTAKF